MGESSEKRIVVSPVASRRLASAAQWLVARGRSERVLIIGSVEATSQLSRSVARTLGSSFGWERLTLGRVAGALAGPALAAQGLTPVGALPLEALSARIVHTLGDSLGRFVPIKDRPGLPRALMRTLDELRLAALEKEPFADEDLARLLTAYGQELTLAKLADRARVLTLAAEAASDPSSSNALLGIPLLLLDAPVANVRERDLVAALARRALVVLATVPDGDDRTLFHLHAAMKTTNAGADAGAEETAGLTRLQSRLFSVDQALTTESAGQEMEILSAPGESRECVEIARRVRRESERGTPFDAMAILLRSPPQYRAHVEEALRRASIPAYFARGTVQPDPTGRAFLALLACAADGLSARRFAEYLSLGEVADATDKGAPPAAAAPGSLYVPPEVDLIPDTIARAEEPPEEEEPIAAVTSPNPEGVAVVDGTLRTPRRWERLLVESAVIGGLDRWKARLEGLQAKLSQDLANEPEHASAERRRRDLSDLEALRGYALPLLEEMTALPKAATWEKWLHALSALATRALRQPARVLAVLSELDPMKT
ncbi:MAG: PD-(D/E)XK nuclease family protein, partial [Polyangiaceae bacterium]